MSEEIFTVVTDIKMDTTTYTVEIKEPQTKLNQKLHLLSLYKKLPKGFSSCFYTINDDEYIYLSDFDIRV
jgi:hypothetical protein